MVRSAAELDLQQFLGGGTPSPTAWEDEVVYFLLVDRFSDGSEGVTTPLFTPGDAGNAVTTEVEAARWRAAGVSWAGGTLRGVRSKLGYLADLGVTAVWLSPVLRQARTREGEPESYHGYGTQNFLEVDPHLGTADDLRDLVAEAHALGMRVILDVVLNHAGDVFAYRRQPDRNTGELTDLPNYAPGGYDVEAWHVLGGADVPFTREAALAGYPAAAVWPSELVEPGVFSAKGRIREGHWDDLPETLDGDFKDLKDIRHGAGDVADYVASPALEAVIRCHQYWLGFADVDGFRVDTVKHMDRGASRLFCSALHEFAQAVGKDAFYLIGEVAGSRELAVQVQQLTGLDAVLGLGAAAWGLVATTCGYADPAPAYFDLFRNSDLLGMGSHAWLRDRVVTAYDDHDQIRQGGAGSRRYRFPNEPAGRERALAVLALNVLTLGIPCIYYGSEQLLDGEGGDDRYIREAMFGGEFGAFRSRGRHVFDETSRTYVELARLLAVRAAEPALRRGRQYLREISGDGQRFGLPTGFGGPVRSVVAWSRILFETEVLCAINTDAAAQRGAWVVVDARLHPPGSTLTRLFPTAAGAPPTLTVLGTPAGSAVQLTLPPAGVAVYR